MPSLHLENAYSNAYIHYTKKWKSTKIIKKFINTKAAFKICDTPYPPLSRGENPQISPSIDGRDNGRGIV